MSNFEVSINPEIFKYAIDISGYTDEEIIKKVDTKKFTKNYLEKLSSGAEKPKLIELKKIDSLLKRGIPFYFLDETPYEAKLLKYRKKFPKLGLDPKTLVTLRDFNFLREEIKFMIEENELDYTRKLRVFSLKENAETVACHFRKLFELDKLNVSKLKEEEFFDFLRTKIESYVYVFRNYPNTEKLNGNLRGCIFLDDELPALILINSNDNKKAEIFTLLHEFAHYLLNKEEVDANKLVEDFDNKAERWCNEFAYKVLITEESEIKEKFTKDNPVLLTKENLENISNKYKVSKLAFMYRFFVLKIIDSDKYNNFKKKNPYKKSEKKKEKGGNYYATIRSKLSRKFISLVVRSHKNNIISDIEAFKYLKVSNFDRFEFMQEVIK